MINTEDRDGIRFARMEHGKVNAFDLEFVLALAATIDAAESDPIGAVVLTGRGRVFSAGVDLLRVLDEGREYLETFLPALDRAFDKCLRFSKPLVAAINGHAIAGGGVLACVADYRVLAAGGAKIGVPELMVGVPFPPVALEAVRATVSPSHFRRLVHTGELVAGDDARASGLVDEIVAEEELESRAFELAKQLASIPTATFAQHKRDWRAPLLAASTKNVHESVERVWCDPATLAAISEYVEKTLGKGARPKQLE